MGSLPALTACQSLTLNLLTQLLHVYLDLAELEIPSTIEMTFPDPADILNFEVRISPDDGKILTAVFYASAFFRFLH